MIVGVPRERKAEESRVGLTPAAARELARRGHETVVETDAGRAIGLDDAEYAAAGARIVPDAEAVFGAADMIVKVKEPQPAEYGLLRQGQLLFAYLHLAPDAAQTEALLDSGCIAIAYETVTDGLGGLPLLRPMSEIAGRLSVQIGARCLEIPAGGRGTLLGGAPGVAPGRVAIVGGGIVGANAAFVARGLGAEVAILDNSLRRLAELDARFGGAVTTLHSTAEAIEQEVRRADLVIGAVLLPGARTPRLITRAMIEAMKRGSVALDVAIDQGGCFETSRPTTHDRPTFVEHGVVHSCIANMPAAAGRTATFALTNATLPFVLRLADEGWAAALRNDAHLRQGLNVHRGRLTHEAVARAQGRDYLPAEEAAAS